MKRLDRVRKLLGFLRVHRRRLFDDAFQDELATMYRDTGAGKSPVPLALMAMATLVQAYLDVSDAEMVELTVVDLRVQMVLDRLGADAPAFSQGALVDFRDRLIRADMDRRGPKLKRSQASSNNSTNSSGGGRRSCSRAHVRDEVAPHLDTLHQIRAQDLEVTPHGPRINGYKRHIATDLDTGLIVAVAITPANLPEQTAMPILQDDLEHQHIVIRELFIDRGYIASDVIEDNVSKMSAACEVYEGGGSWASGPHRFRRSTTTTPSPPDRYASRP